MGISNDANLELESVSPIEKNTIMNTWTDLLYSMNSWGCSADWHDDTSAENNMQPST